MGRPIQQQAVNTAQVQKEEQRALLYSKKTSIFEQLDCLHDVPKKDLAHLVDLSTFRTFLAGEVIVSEHKDSEFFYIILQGNIYLSLHGKNGEEIVLEALSRGDCCGEGPLFSGFARRTSAYAQSHCYTLQLPVVELRSLMTREPKLHDVLKRVYLRRLVESTLAGVPLFSHISPMERLSLAALLHPISYPRHSTIVKQGEAGSMLYVIESGQVVVEQDGQAISCLDHGDFFGEIALFTHKPHSATVRTLAPTNVLTLSAPSFYRLLGQRPELTEKFNAVVEERRTQNKTLLHDYARSERLHIAIEHGLLRGMSRLLVRTPSLCPEGCRLCEIACITRHGQSRLRLNGVQIGMYDIVDACRQCRVGAECIEACPEDAFEWNEQGVLIITDKCTGCGDCIEACPYHVINRMRTVPKRFGEPAREMIRKLRRMLQPENTPMTEELMCPYRADKCDLCYGYDDLACLSGCPTGALRLVAIEDIVNL